MALFVVICGALLMLGGGYSLLMGFDVVMTERGAAMAIGGTVALAGGVIAVGIGGALLRLSQILRALEQRQPKPRGPVDRPVVPIKEPETVTPERSPVAEEAKPSSLAPLGAGVAASALIGGTVLASSRLPVAEETLAPDVMASGPLSNPPVEAVVPSLLPVEPAMKREDHILEALKAEIATPVPVVATKPDLEEELARALAEFDAPPMPPAAEETVPAPASKMTRKRRSWSSRKELEDPTAELKPEDFAKADMNAVENAVAAEPLPAPDHVAVSDEEAMPEHQTLDVPEPVSAFESDQEGKDVMENTPQDISALDSTRPKVLGTYNVGGRTYSMYADGSVEAVTEFGVERFASMDELRRHLART